MGIFQQSGAVLQKGNAALDHERQTGKNEIVEIGKDD